MAGRAGVRRPSAAVGFVLDFGPLLAFFAAYKLQGLIAGTAVFMAGIVIALSVSFALYRRVSPMSVVSAVLVLGFGALTIWFHNPRFIQLKPTIIYSGFAALLLGGLAAGRPLLRYLFGPVFEGLSHEGWLKLSRNWGLFFVAMAVLNEVLRATLSFDSWLTAKVWGITLLSLVFALANIPMLLRHGLSPGEAKDEPIPPPSL
jgi:intracellular septation protein